MKKERLKVSLCDSGHYLDYQALGKEFTTCWNAVAK